MLVSLSYNENYFIFNNVFLSGRIMSDVTLPKYQQSKLSGILLRARKFGLVRAFYACFWQLSVQRQNARNPRWRRWFSVDAIMVFLHWCCSLFGIALPIVINVLVGLVWASYWVLARAFLFLSSAVCICACFHAGLFDSRYVSFVLSRPLRFCVLKSHWVVRVIGLLLAIMIASLLVCLFLLVTHVMCGRWLIVLLARVFPFGVLYHLPTRCGLHFGATGLLLVSTCLLEGCCTAWCSSGLNLVSATNWRGSFFVNLFLSPLYRV